MSYARMLCFIACGLGFNSTTFLFSYVFSVPGIGLSASHTAAKAKSLSRVQCDFYYLNFSYSFYVIFFPEFRLGRKYFHVCSFNFTCTSSCLHSFKAQLPGWGCRQVVKRLLANMYKILDSISKHSNTLISHYLLSLTLFILAHM